MKRVGVAAIIHNYKDEVLLGKRAKDPNRGLYVFPGGGVEDNETLEQTLCREVKEETGYDVLPDADRWNKPVFIADLDDRLIVFVEAKVTKPNDAPVASSDLEEVGWFGNWNMPELSPVVRPVLVSVQRLNDDRIKASYYSPYSGGHSSW